MAKSEVGQARAQVQSHPLISIGGTELLAGLRVALVWLETNKEVINDLNVFPVPDGDTGSNMYMTLRAAVGEAESAREQASAAAVMEAVAHGSLMGARGNSGVILSQVLRGFARGSAGLERLDAQALAFALGEGARVAHSAVMKPTEGTMLTVIREVGRAAAAAALQSDDVRHVLSTAVAEAHEAVEKTTSQLPILAEAGVVDAGGFGLAVILEGLSHSLEEVAGEDPELAPLSIRPRTEPRVLAPGEVAPAAVVGQARVGMAEGGWGYCTEFLIHDPGKPVEELQGLLGSMGESALVVGDEQLVRVHIHTHNPGDLIAAASREGALSHLKVEDMSEQHHAILARVEDAVAPGGAGAADTPPAAPVEKELGVVAVAAGAGFREIFESLGADVVVDGGQTMNPSTEDLLSAVERTNAAQVLLLPNNSNVIMAAQQAARLARDGRVEVVASRSLPQGVSALLALAPDDSAAANGDRMRAAATSVRTVEITHAVRTTVSKGLHIRAGDVIGLLDDEITVTGKDEYEVAEAMLHKIGDPVSLVTVYFGQEITTDGADALVNRLRTAFPDIEFEVHEGGQPHYPYILSLE